MLIPLYSFRSSSLELHWTTLFLTCCSAEGQKAAFAMPTNTKRLSIPLLPFLSLCELSAFRDVHHCHRFTLFSVTRFWVSKRAWHPFICVTLGMRSRVGVSKPAERFRSTKEWWLNPNYLLREGVPAQPLDDLLPEWCWGRRELEEEDDGSEATLDSPENPFHELEVVGLKTSVLWVICVFVISELTRTTWQIWIPLLALLRDKEQWLL